MRLIRVQCEDWKPGLCEFERGHCKTPILFPPARGAVAQLAVEPIDRMSQLPNNLRHDRSAAHLRYVAKATLPGGRWMLPALIAQT
jgi:hypothetical protein